MGLCTEFWEGNVRVFSDDFGRLIRKSTSLFVEVIEKKENLFELSCARLHVTGDIYLFGDENGIVVEYSPGTNPYLLNHLAKTLSILGYTKVKPVKRVEVESLGKQWNKLSLFKRILYGTVLFKYIG